MINLSWGGIDAYSQFGQDVINYAVLYRDAVVVAAAGNTHGNLDFYPASYDNVLSVGATDSHDNLASWATYSYHIDIMAPGNHVYTTDNNGGYSRKLGTSFSSPQVAGAAALVRAHFPDLTAQQVMEQLRVTADDIYGTGSNGNFQGMLGRGRLNMARALTETSSPAVRMSAFDYKGNFDHLVFPGDTVKIDASFINYLSKASNLQVTLSSPDENLKMINGNLGLGDLATLEKTDTGENPFVFQVPEDAMPGQKMVFRLDFIGDGYSDFQYFNIFVAPESFDFQVGPLSLTIGSDGSLGYNNIDFPNGQGMHFNNEMVASQFGLVAKDASHVSDNIINNFTTNNGDHDFQTIEYARLYENTKADKEARSSFAERFDLTNKIGIKVEQKTLGWENPENGPFIVVEYRLTNLTDSMMTSLDAGVFADWDLNNMQHNAVEWDGENKLGYTFDKETNGLFAGMAILSDEGSPAFHAIDKGAFGGNTSEIQDTLNNARKFGFLSSGLTKTSAGQNGTGNDVAQLIGVNGLSLKPKQSKKVAFVFLLGESKTELLQKLQEAHTKYEEYVSNPPVDRMLYACKGQSVTIPQGEGQTLEFYEDAQLTQRLDSGANYHTPPIDGSQTYFTVKVEDGFRSEAGRVLVKTSVPETGFVYQLDTLDISQKSLLHFYSTADHVAGLQWLVNGEKTSDAEIFDLDFQDKPEFTITQVSTDSIGCYDSLKMLIKPALSANPQAGNIVYCPGTQVSVEPKNGNMFYFYDDEQLAHLIHKGRALTWNSLTGEKTVYVTGMDNLLESEPVAVNLSPTALKADFVFSEDTINLAIKSKLQITNTSQDADWFYWILPSQAVDSAQVLNRDIRQETGYQYQLVAGDQYGCIDTVKRSVTVVDITALDEKHILPTTLYPNPATERISLTGIKISNVKLPYQILDSRGTVVGEGAEGSQPGSPFTVGIAGLAKGIYFIKIYNQDHLYFGKFLKQ